MRKSLDKYVLATIMLQAFCVEFVLEYTIEPMREKSVKTVNTLSDGMLLGDVAFDKTIPWSCGNYLTTTTKVGEASANTTRRINVTSMSTSSALTTRVRSTTSGITTDQSDTTSITVSTSTMSAQNRAQWKTEAEEESKKTISVVYKRKSANTWEKRSKELHPAVTDELDTHLAAIYSKFSNENMNYSSVAMLTYNDNGKSCMIHNDYSIYGTHEHVTYLAQPRFQDKLAPHKTDLLGDYEQQILDKTFSSPSSDLCKTATKAIKDVLKLSVEKKASAFVVVRCGYKFVWYQLGYAYFPAAHSTSPYVLESHQDNIYSAKCGQIVLLP